LLRNAQQRRARKTITHKLVIPSATGGESVSVNYGFFIGATSENLPDLLKAHPTPGIKIFMGSMHGPLLVDTEAALEAIFAQGQRLIAVHAEDRARIEQRRLEFAGIHDPKIHIANSRQSSGFTCYSTGCKTG
jgi:dihydroorotase-like cyclic amidohydrolase